MAHTTATIFGLALAAVAIGVNATRYPIVWQMTGPVLAAKPADELPPPSIALERPADEIPQAPAPEETAPSAPDDPQMEETAAEPKNDPPDAYAPPPPDESPAASPMTEEPLAPVHFAGLAADSEGDRDLAQSVRRLPPVDVYGPVPSIIQPPGGAIPVYPSTGVE